MKAYNRRELRVRRSGNTVYLEVLERGRLVQTNRAGRIQGDTLVLETRRTRTGDGIKRPARPCVNCGQPMEHLPKVCTNWLPNGTYRCESCGTHWLGLVGFVDKDSI